MTSLYGGQPGLSFNLRKKYSSVKEMETEFNRGDECTDVWYGDYCLIDTENKNHPDNGKLYRRELKGTGDKTESGSYLPYSYIGQIVGSTAAAPAIAFKEKDSENGISTTPDIESQMWEWDEQRKAYISTVKQKNPAISFKLGSSTLSENIAEVTWTNIRSDINDSNENAISSWALAELTVPTLNVEFTPDSNATAYSGFQIQEEDTDIENPFYKKFIVTIPSGKQGTSITDVKIMSGESIKSDNAFTLTDSEKNNILNTYSYLVYTQVDYTNEISNTTKHIIGSFNVINNLNWDSDNAQLEIELTAGETKEITVPYITGITAAENSGKWPLTFSFAGRESITPELSLLKDIEINPETGAVTKQYYSEDSSTKIDGSLKWPQTITFDEETGDLSYQLNDETNGTIIGTLKYPKNIELDENNNNLLITYAGDTSSTELGHLDLVNNIFVKEDGNFYFTIPGSESPENQITTSSPLLSIGDVFISPQEGKLNLSYKRVNPKGEKDGDKPALQDTEIPFIEDISFLDTSSPVSFDNISNEIRKAIDEAVKSRFQGLDSLQGDKKLTIKYRGAEKKEGENAWEVAHLTGSSSSISNIVDVAVQDGNVYVLFSDPEIRRAGALPGDISVLQEGWRKDIDGTFYKYSELKEVSIENSDIDVVNNGCYFWKKIGSVKPEGILFATVLLGEGEFLDKNGDPLPVGEPIKIQDQVEITLQKNDPQSWKDYLENFYTPLIDSVAEDLNEGKVLAIRFSTGLYEDNPFTLYYFCEGLKENGGGVWSQIDLGSSGNNGDTSSQEKDEIAVIDGNNPDSSNAEIKLAKGTVSITTDLTVLFEDPFTN